MILSDKLCNELLSLESDIEKITKSKNTNDIQMENFLRNLEKRRYNILSEIKLYNNTVEYKTDKIKNISHEYKAEVIDDTLKIYIPEPMPSYRNLKTHAYKNILLNITEVTKPYQNMFSEKVFVYIKIFDNIKGWDIDNKFIKPIFDSLIANKIIKDDNIDEMFYAAGGAFSKEPHTEVYITNIKNAENLFKNVLDENVFFSDF